MPLQIEQVNLDKVSQQKITALIARYRGGRLSQHGLYRRICSVHFTAGRKS